MKIKKPKFWDYNKPNILALFLWPLSLVFKSVANFKKNKQIKYPDIKTICLGNIYLGGTGKTSLAIKIKKILDSKNVKSCFIKKLHNDQKDEVKLLEKYGKTIVRRTRSDALKQAIYENYEFAIFDDGLQDSSISYDLSFVCFNKLNWIGNGLLIPAGPLRESLKKLKSYKNVFLNGNDENLTTIKKQLKEINLDLNIHESEYSIVNTQEFSKSYKYLAFSGIGNHQTFIDMLKKNEFSIVQELEFPDHYNYKNTDLKKINLIASNLDAKIITTEKDFMRLGSFQNKNIRYIKTKLVLKDEKKLINLLIN